jgi:L,D-peptidoglycan transpeptidase YkuD (ErfK/YbiS/YcfS/YnhG family)
LRALALAALVACSSRPTRAPAPPSPIARAPQLIVGVVDGWDTTGATLQRYERADAAWRAVGEPVHAVIGRAGAAWGRGLHGDGAPPGRSGPLKQEGDGRSPAGAFEVVRAFGYANAPVDGAALPYHALDAEWRCVDDPASAHYNEVLDAEDVPVDWGSAEIMRRDDELYTWVIELAHNAEAKPGAGSCIFFHVWGGEGSTTAGCTAMPQRDLEALLAWVRPGAAYVLLPRAERDALAATWGLP